jgi:uncharacterized LabA/DUF88 family protein
MGFNTAIFYDMENLLKGYGFSQQMITSLSLKDILHSIKETKKPGEIAIQRAYADWSHPRLGILRGEINDLGIDPIQVFGFAQDAKKNAADIQLAIDAIDLAYTRPALQTFVIVSGDGGFAALAKKLHEYGKTVIGCGYRKATNRVFQAVCDEFVWLSDPEEEERQERLSFPVANNVSPHLTDPRTVRLSAKVKVLTANSDKDIIAKTKEVLNWFEKDTTLRASLKEGGIHLSAIREALKYAIPDFQPARLGFPKFVEYLQFACKASALCIVRVPPSEVLVALRNATPPGSEILPDLDRRDVHSVENYRAVLTAASTSGPAFRLPPSKDLLEVAVWISQRSPQKEPFGPMVEAAGSGLYPAVSSESAKLALICFVNAGVFERENDRASLSELEVNLRSDLMSSALILGALQKTVREKLESVLIQVNDEVLQQMIPA